MEAEALASWQEAHALEEEFREHWHVEVGYGGIRHSAQDLPRSIQFWYWNILEISFAFSRCRKSRLDGFEEFQFQQYLVQSRGSHCPEAPPALQLWKAPLAMRQILEEVLDPEARGKSPSEMKPTKLGNTLLKWIVFSLALSLAELFEKAMERERDC